MRLHTTCASCGRALAAPHHQVAVHDGCPPSPRRADSYARALLAAASAGDDAAADHWAAQLDAWDQREPDLRSAALAYAAWGWPVFPCRPGGKRPITTHGLHDASTDAQTIHDWWSRVPTAAVGIATGHHFDVLDVDPAGLRLWADQHAALDVDVHGLVSTPRGGLHAYLTPTGAGNLAHVVPGWDYRGRGGYVIAPPTVLAPAALAGHPAPPWPLRYQWLAYPSLDITGQGGGGS